MPPPAPSEADLPGHHVVLEVLEGTLPSAVREAERLGPVTPVGPREIHLVTEDLAAARELRRVVAAYDVLTVPARRPRELLETSVQQRIAAHIAGIRRLRPRALFTGVRFRAAGADTPDMSRLARAIADAASLPLSEDGDLVVRVRRASDHTAPDVPPRPYPAWEVLLRLTPRPLSARAWRTQNYPGAVNATIAACVLDMLEIGANDQLLDMTCGSGTFLIEQLHEVAPARAVGVDVDEGALEAAREHQRAARRRGRIDWVHGDGLEVPREGGFTRILTNPPWGTLHGRHETNQELLAALLARAGQLAAPGARLGVLTHEVRRMRTVLDEEAGPWELVTEHRFFQKGHHPRLFLLRLGPDAQ